MYCPNCGKELPDDSDHCTECRAHWGKVQTTTTPTLEEFAEALRKSRESQEIRAYDKRKEEEEHDRRMTQLMEEIKQKHAHKLRPEAESSRTDETDDKENQDHG